MKTISIEAFQNHLIENPVIIDVRAPVEFSSGAIPGSINIPILTNEERHAVGLCYKTKGREDAIELGHSIVSGENLEAKRNRWKQTLEQHPKAWITCFRGGLRSQSAQKFLLEQGVDVPRLQGGYKAARNFFIENLSAATKENYLLISGTTGSGKTQVLQDINSFYPMVDIEDLAHHRGSAFGSLSIPQPSQSDFENKLSLELFKKSKREAKHLPVLLEDESRVLGAVYIPEIFFIRMRESQVVLVQESVEKRTENIFFDYIQKPLASGDQNEFARLFQQYKNSVLKIQKKLGGLRAQELLANLEQCEKDYQEHQDLTRNSEWIEKLLVWYYDPMYLGSLERRKPVIAASGTAEEIKSYLRSLV